MQAAALNDSQQTEYAWTPGYRAKVKAQVAGPILVKIAGNDETILAKQALREARKPSSPLHPAFPWDDKIAAEEYRLIQARLMIRSIRLVDQQTGDLVRVFVHVTSQEIAEPAYMSVSAVMSTSTLRDNVLEKAIADLKAWRARYAGLKELAEVYSAIDKVATS